LYKNSAIKIKKICFRTFRIFFYGDLDQWSPAAVAQAAHGPEIFSVVALSPRFDFAAFR